MIRLCYFACVVAVATTTAASAQTSPDAPRLSEADRSAIRASCRSDIPKHCPGLRPDDGKLRSCLVEKIGSFNEACRNALGKAGIKGN